jgi:hypothetical protein
MAEATQVAATSATDAVKTAKAHIATLDPTSDVIAGVKDHPSAKGLIAAVQAHGEALVNATGDLVAAVDFDKVSASQAAGSHAGNAHIDMGKLSAATAGLKKASDLSAVTSAVNGLASDAALISEMKEGFKAKGLSGGYDEVRGALKSIDVDQIGVVQHLEAVIAQAKAEGSEDAAAFAHIHAELQEVDKNLKGQLSTLLSAIDGFVGKLAA